MRARRVSRAGEAMSESDTKSYAGDVPPQDAWEALSTVEPATLIDVRTKPEWSYVGVPRLDALGKSLIQIEWNVYPSMAVAPRFAARLATELEARGVGHDAPLYFICRSGQRSRNAAIAMTAAGYSKCFNVTSGFEGSPNAEGHRGTVDGWKVDGLPWVQS